MDHVWWRTHLRQLPELGFLEKWGNFGQVDDWMPFLTETLDVPPYGKVVELGCGRGSFSVRLAQWGFEVTGVDESGPMLEIARQAAERRDVEVEFRQGHPRVLPERGVYDAALILDFGTYGDADNAEMLRAVAAALKPGGKLLFGACNPYYWCREPKTEHQSVEGLDVISRREFDFNTGTVVSRVRCILPTGERRVLPIARYRAYTLPELRALVTATGLSDLKVYGQEPGRAPHADGALDSLNTPYVHCVALKAVTGMSGEGI